MKITVRYIELSIPVEPRDVVARIQEEVKQAVAKAFRNGARSIGMPGIEVKPDGLNLFVKLVTNEELDVIMAKNIDLYLGTLGRFVFYFDDLSFDRDEVSILYMATVYEFPGRNSEYDRLRLQLENIQQAFAVKITSQEPPCGVAMAFEFQGRVSFADWLQVKAMILEVRPKAPKEATGFAFEWPTASK